MSDAPPRSPYIVGPVYDWLFFLSPPAMSVLVGALVARSPSAHRIVHVQGDGVPLDALLINALIHAHLVAVIFRSHMNGAIFRRHWLRFVIVPIVLWVALRTWLWLAVTSLVVATFWDVWHSGAQTFGLARIYERNVGNDSNAGRTLDFWLNQLLYAGPIVAGASMIDHFDSFEVFELIDARRLASVPAFMVATHRYWRVSLLAFGALFLVGYLLAYARLWARGHRVSWLKVWLLTSTGVCSVFTWGTNPWGQAFLIMNLFHAVQYLALVWHSEGRRLLDASGLSRWRAGKLVGFALFALVVSSYGVGATLVDVSRRNLWALTMVVSLMHFWYDGFLWSVGRKQV